MKKLIYAIIIAILLLFAPTIPYDNQLKSGAVVIEHKTVAKWLMDEYLGVQK
jgi:hypothetical protein